MNKLSTPLHANSKPTRVPHLETNMYDAVSDEEETSRIEREMSAIIESFFVSPAKKKKEEFEEPYTSSNSKHLLDAKR